MGWDIFNGSPHTNFFVIDFYSIFPYIIFNNFLEGEPREGWNLPSIYILLSVDELNIVAFAIISPMYSKEQVEFIFADFPTAGNVST